MCLYYNTIANICKQLFFCHCEEPGSGDEAISVVALNIFTLSFRPEGEIAWKRGVAQTIVASRLRDSSPPRRRLGMTKSGNDNQIWTYLKYEKSI